MFADYPNRHFPMMRSRCAYTLFSLVGALLCAPLLHSAQEEPGPRVVIDLGNTPWSFAKVLPPTTDNVSSGKPVKVSDNTTAVTYEVDLGQPCDLERVRFSFANPQIDAVSFVLDAALESEEAWTNL